MDNIAFDLMGNIMLKPTSWGLLKGKGTRNLFAGSGALGSLTSGTQNVVIGYQAGDSITDGNQNTLIGYQAGYGQNFSSGTFVGRYSGYNNTGDSITANGTYSARSNTGASVTVSGTYAGLSNTGNNVTGSGYNSVRKNTGSNVTAIGYYAGFDNKGNNVTGSGYNSVHKNTGDNIIASGIEAARSNDADNIVALGYGAFSDFNEDSGNAKTVDTVLPDTERVTITGHGFGSTGTMLNLKASTTDTLPSGLSASPELWEVIDANTLECKSDSFTDVGVGTHTLTPQFVYNDSVAIGYQAEPDAAEQLVIMNGDVNATPLIKGDFASGDIYFQGSVGVGTTTPATSAAVEISSTTGALLLPRMTSTQRGNLTAVNGMVIYNTTTNQIEGYTNSSWSAL